jgi:hypothetical protein
MSRQRFFAKRNQGGTWSVVDRTDGRIAEMRGVLLVGLGQELATDMAELLVMEDRKERSDAPE